jgi:hypothetical protein
MDACLFCDRCEPGHGPSCEYTCGSCVQLLMSMDDLSTAHKRATEKKYHRKAKAIEIFIGRAVAKNGKAEKPKRNLERKRPLRTIRSSRDRIRT